MSVSAPNLKIGRGRSCVRGDAPAATRTVGARSAPAVAVATWAYFVRGLNSDGSSREWLFARGSAKKTETNEDKGERSAFMLTDASSLTALADECVVSAGS